MRTATHVLLLVAALVVVATLVGCGSPSDTSQSPSGSNASPEEAARTLGTTTDAPVTKLPSGLQYIDAKVGTGAAAKAGDTVEVNYTGWLVDGTQFDSSVGRSPFIFPLGAGRVIKGWDEGVVGMKPGGIRKLIVPSELGYGATGAGDDIPPKATLIFEVVLHKSAS